MSPSNAALCILVGMVVLLADGGTALPMSVYSEWFMHEQDCRDIAGNRDLYDDVARVCSDCQNVFRNSNIGTTCRKNCFYNTDFKLCVEALQLSSELPELMRKIHVIK
ncbi:Arthropod neurohormone/Alpha-latrotoxin associated low molecular weight protein, partial [Trinorchestia longiramus]